MSKKIEFTEYNPNWPKIFEIESEKINLALGDNCVIIHHIGSTSIAGLAAKPKIDILAVVKEPSLTIEILEREGFTYKGDWNIPFQYGFTKRGAVNVNLHVYEENHPEIELNLFFRDYLLSTPKARDEYAKLKSQLLLHDASGEKRNNMFVGYTLGKDAFIRSIIEQSGFNRLRFLICTHHIELEAAKYFRQKYFTDKGLKDDKYKLTFNHPDHIHLVLYEGIKIIGYVHIELLQDKQAVIRIIVIDETNSNKGFEWKFLELIEKWLKFRGYKSIAE